MKGKVLLGESPKKQGMASTGHAFRMIDLFYFAFLFSITKELWNDVFALPFFPS